MLKLFVVALIGTVLTYATLATAQPVSEDKLTAARESFRVGKKKLEAGDYSGALIEYRIADAVVKKPSTRLGVARALVGLGRLVEARAEALSVADMPAPPDEHPTLVKAREDAARLGKELNGRIARVTFIIKPTEAEIVLDNQLLAPTQRKNFEIDPGEHTIVVRAEGHKTLRRSFSAPAGKDYPLKLQLVRADQQNTPQAAPVASPFSDESTIATEDTTTDITLIGGISSLVVGAALFGVGVWGMTEVDSAMNDAGFQQWRAEPANANAADVCELAPPQDVADLCSKMKSGEITQAVAFPFAAVAAGVGVALIVISPTVSGGDETKAEAGLSVTPMLSPHYLGAQLGYSF